LSNDFHRFDEITVYGVIGELFNATHRINGDTQAGMEK